MENTEVAIREVGLDIQKPPAEVLVAAREAAKSLADVVNSKTKKVIINGEQYLEFEDWETIGHFYGVHVRTRDAVPVEVYGVQGAKAQADLLNGAGVVIGGAEAYCLRDEDNWTKKPWFQLASMAQTRAASKTLSNALRWVVVLAGYRGTPAEEMTGQETKASIPAEHYCIEHKMEWFKRGKMTSYAHPFEDEEGKRWCHEPVKAPVQAPGTVKDKAQAQADGKAVYPAGEDGRKAGFVDREWLAMALSTLQDKKVTGWTDKGVLAALAKNYGVQGASVMEAVAHLTEEQAFAFCEKVKSVVQGA